MTNYLKNFLDKERQTFIKNKDTMTPAEYMEWNSKYEARLVNFVLDLVEKEIEKTLVPPIEWKECVKAYHNRDDYCAVCGFNPDILSGELSTIINNLRV